MYEVITDWTVNGHSGLASVMYFNETPTLATIRASIHSLYTNVQGLLSTTTTWSIRTNGRQIAAEQGELLGVWNEPTVKSASGTAVAASVSDATQVLLRWSTGVVVNSHFVKGRTFIPGYTSAGFLGGDLAASSITSFNNAATQFANDPNGFVIWARPFKPKTGETGTARDGSSHQVVAGSVWKETAVLRRRRL